MLFKRKLKLTIDIAGQKKTYEHDTENHSLNINFNIQKALQKAETASIDIIGLPLNDIQELSTKFDYTKKTIKPNFVMIEAGYDSDFGVIFKGATTQALPSLNGADFTLSLKAQGGYYAITKYEPISLKQAKLKDLAQAIANIFEYNLRFNATNKDIGDVTFSLENGNKLLHFVTYVNIFVLQTFLLYSKKSKFISDRHNAWFCFCL